MNVALILLLAGIGLTTAQVPGFGGCPEFDSQQDFDMNKFLGTWYEAERYVNIFEAGTRCVKTNYSKTADGRYLVANEIMNRFTNVKRVLDGEVRLILKGSESKLNVRYPNLPIPYESQLMVLDTDYTSYSVMWSCTSLGIINTQNAWIMTREKLAPGTVLQKAYDILDKYKLSRTFFFKTDQNSCELKSDPGQEHGNAAPSSVPSIAASASGTKNKPVKKIAQKKNGQGAAAGGNRDETAQKTDEVPSTEVKQQSHSQQQQNHHHQPQQHHQQSSHSHQQQQSNQHHHHDGQAKVPAPVPVIPVAAPVPVPASTSSTSVPVVGAAATPAAAAVAAPVANDDVGQKVETSNV